MSRPHSATAITGFLLALLLMPGVQQAAAQQTSGIRQEEAARRLRKTVQFYREQVASQGGYLWRYSADLQRREGEGKASATTVWVQPPGTPAVGAALLDVYELTGDKYYLEAARETAEALIRGQLQSGGWDYRIEFDPQDRKRYAYRTDGKDEGRNATTLDDNTTQSALSFLIRIDQTLQQKDSTLHEAVLYGLASLMKAQYPNGAWPQRYDEFSAPEDYPVQAASYPDSWSRTHPKKDYRGYYTFNDNSIADTIRLMFQAWQVYEDDGYRRSAEKAGDFILLAQMPDPQPAWAQQYDRDMHPAWARKFEPPAITGGESQGILRTLIMLFDYTGDEKYLKPIPVAVEYLESSSLPGGGLARFYELKTNRPLYFTRQYELTYEDDDLPTHYGFKVGSKLESIQQQYERARDQGPRNPRHKPLRPRNLSSGLARRAAELTAAMDQRGAWVEPGSLRYQGEKQGEADATDRILDMRTFATRIRQLAEFVGASEK